MNWNRKWIILIAICFLFSDKRHYIFSRVSLITGIEKTNIVGLDIELICNSNLPAKHIKWCIYNFKHLTEGWSEASSTNTNIVSNSFLLQFKNSLTYLSIPTSFLFSLEEKYKDIKFLFTKRLKTSNCKLIIGF